MSPEILPFDRERWNAAIQGLPGAHILQTFEWGQVKACYGWKPIPLVWRSESGTVEAAGLALQRSVNLLGSAVQLKIIYLPKGPLMDWSDQQLRSRVLQDLQDLGIQQRAIFVKMDPDVILGTGVPGQPDASEDLLGGDVSQALQERAWRYSQDQIQFRNTVLIDLQAGEDELLARMKQKTRYNIRLAERKGVTTRIGGEGDLARLYRLYAETSVRDGFVIRDEAYYRTVWTTFMQAGLAEPIIAEVEGETVAAVFIFRFGERAWYIYGMSSQAHREKMPNYLLQWEAMRRARQAGCRTYDLWGAPEVFDERDSMWGVYRFKEGLGGTPVRTLGAWDYPVHPGLYRLYTETLPKILAVMRRRGKERTQQNIT